MVKRIAWVLAVFVIGSAVLIVSILQSPSLMQELIKFLVQRNISGCTVDQLTIGRQQWGYPCDLRLFNIVVRMSSKDVHWSVKILRLSGYDLHHVWRSRARIPVVVEGIEVLGGPFVIHGAYANGEVDLLDRSLDTWRADVGADQLQAQKYQLTHISAIVTGTKREIEVGDFNADCYQGHLKANFNILLTKPVGYHAFVHLKEMNVDLLQGVNDVLYQQIQGVMDADVSFEGQGNHLQIGMITVNMTRNAQIRATLLQFVVPYIPPTQDLAGFQELIRKDLKVPVERANLSLQGTQNEKLTGEIHLGVRKINLNLNLPIDILFDGSLISLMQWYQRFVH